MAKRGPEVIKLISCLTALSMKFQLLIKLKYRKVNTFSTFKLSHVVCLLPINVKMPTLLSRINFTLS